MDVQDRAARIDVLNLSAPVKESAAGSPVSANAKGAFAASLKSQASPATASSVGEACVAPTEETNQAVIETSSPWLSELLLTAMPRDGVIDALPADHLPAEISSDTDEDIDTAARQFLASILAANRVPHAPAVPAIESTPPGLASAIASLAERFGTIHAVISTPAERPAMPPGLQIALAASSAEPAHINGAAAQISEREVDPAASASTNLQLAAESDTNLSASLPATAAGSKLSPTPDPSNDHATATDDRPKSDSESATRAAEIAPVTPVAALAPHSTLSFASSEPKAQGIVGRASESRAATIFASSLPATDEHERVAEIPPWSGAANIAHGDLRGEAIAAPPRHASAAPSIVDQLQPALARAAAGERPLSIVLRPPELGAIRIDISQPAGQLSARLEVESPVAHQLLTDSLPQLREVLAPLGVAADQVQIIRMEASSAMETGWRADGQTNAGTSGRGQDAPTQQTTEPQWIDEPDKDDSSSPGMQTRTAINLRI